MLVVSLNSLSAIRKRTTNHEKVAVIGSGSWGTALSTLLASTSDEVIIWSREADVAESINKEHVNCRHLSDSELPHNIVSTTSEAEALTGVDAVVMAAPSAFCALFVLLAHHILIQRLMF